MDTLICKPKMLLCNKAVLKKCLVGLAVLWFSIVLSGCKEVEECEDSGVLADGVTYHRCIGVITNLNQTDIWAISPSETEDIDLVISCTVQPWNVSLKGTLIDTYGTIVAEDSTFSSIDVFDYPMPASEDGYLFFHVTPTEEPISPNPAQTLPGVYSCYFIKHEQV